MDTCDFEYYVKAKRTKIDGDAWYTEGKVYKAKPWVVCGNAQGHKIWSCDHPNYKDRWAQFYDSDFEVVPEPVKAANPDPRWDSYIVCYTCGSYGDTDYETYSNVEAAKSCMESQSNAKLYQLIAETSPSIVDVIL